MKKVILIVCGLVMCGSLLSCSKNEVDKNTNHNNGDIVTDNLTNPEKDVISEDDKGILDSNEEDSEKFLYKLFYFDFEQLKIISRDIELAASGDELGLALTKALQSKIADKAVSLTTEVKLMDMYVDESAGIINLIYNKNFVEEMNLGSALEGGLVTSIINTYGYNFGLDKVAIYFNDELYKGPKGSLEQGYLETDYVNVQEEE